MNTHRGPVTGAGKGRLDRRYSNRTAMSLPAVLITSLADEHPDIIQNVSTLGFKLRSEYGVTVGRFLSLDIPGLTAYSGWVAWSYLDQFGLDVANAIPEPGHRVHHYNGVTGQRGLLPRGRAPKLRHLMVRSAPMSDREVWIQAGAILADTANIPRIISSIRWSLPSATLSP